MILRKVVTTTFLLYLATFPLPTTAQEVFEIESLGTLGGDFSVAKTINSAGHVVGVSQTRQGENHGFLFDGGNRLVDLGTLGGTSSTPTAINDLDQVVGFSHDATGADRAFLWEAGAMVALDDLGSATSRAVDINNRGDVAIATTNGEFGQARTIFWSPATGAIDIGDLGGGFATPVAINANGVIVGTSFDASFEKRAFRWTLGGGMEDFGSATEVTDVNDNGDFCGFRTDPIFPTIPFVVTSAGRKELPTINDFGGHANAINNRGEVAGFTGTWNGLIAVKWRADGTLVDVGDLGSNFAMFFDINDAGTAVGVSLDANRQERGIAWNESDGVLVDLGVLSGGSTSKALAVNEFDQIVGDALDSTGTLAVRWTVAGKSGELIEQIEEIVALVAALEADNILTDGEANELTQKLEGAIDSLEMDNFLAAQNKLNSVLNSLDSSNFVPTVADEFYQLVLIVLTQF